MKRQPKIELNLDKIEQLGEKREEQNYRLRSFLKMKDADWVDKLFHSMNEEVSSQIEAGSLISYPFQNAKKQLPFVTFRSYKLLLSCQKNIRA